jgi:Zn-dependent M28 family amino/carboxypeptidase
MDSTLDLEALELRLRRHVQELARAPRPPGSREHRRAAGYIRERLQELGHSVREVAFQEAGFQGLNLLTTPQPADDSLPWVIIGAHYDSRPETPGADDNASGVAALLELARLLPAGKTWTAHLLLVAYDLEESGMVGSFCHCRELARNGQHVRGMISLEMLGYTDHRPGSQQLPAHLVGLYPDVGNFIGVCANEASRPLMQVVADSLCRVEGLPVEYIAVPGNGEMLFETRLSDHSAFWDRGYPALMVTDTSFFRNPHYHQASDTPETLDYPFLARVTAGACQAVQQLVQFDGPA